MSLIADIHADLENGAVRLIAEYRTRLFADAVQLCGNSTDAEDLVSRTFQKVLSRIDQHRPDGDFYGWMKTILTNIRRDDLDRPVTRGTVAVDAATLERCAGADTSTDDQILANSDRDALREAINQLDPEYRQAVAMYYFNELSLKEIAAFLNSSTSSVSRKLEVARKILAAKLETKLGKKPLAALLAVLLGVGALFGAWQTGLLDPLLSQKGEVDKSGEAYPPSEYPPAERRPAGAAMGGASCEAGAMRGESFPLQEETTSTQTQPQEKPTTTPVQVKEAPKVNIINKTATLAATAATSLALTATAANSVTVKNFDDDLATVYVNDEPTTNGQVVAVGNTVKIELKDFRDDYYFRFAPETQVERNLALGSWEGVPAGYEQANPATFDVTGDLAITPNIDVKGYCWTIDGTTLQNETFRWNFTKNDTTRTIGLAAFKEHVNEVTGNTLTLDLVQRVLFNDKLYTITGFNGSSTLKDSHICEIALPRRFTSFCYKMSSEMSPNAIITNYFYVSDVAAPSYGGYSHYYGAGVSLAGPATNFVARHAVSFRYYDFQGKSRMTGPLVLDSVRSIGKNSFYGCSGLTELYCTSPYLTTIDGTAFAECTQMGKVTIGSSVLTSVDRSAFPANVTNFVFLGAAPPPAVAGNIVGKMSAGVVKTTRFTYDGSRGDWWTLAKSPTEEELDAGLPADCIGVLVDSSGNRKAWIVSDKPLEGMLIETDTTKVENEGYSVRTGLELGDELELIAPEGMSQCELQRMENGEWKTYDTQVGERVTYKHGGELTRVVWRVDGVTLNLGATGYKGTLRVEVKSGELVASSNVYSRGAEVWVTAVGSAERPRSTISRWTGVPAGQEANETVKLVLNGDVSINALFRPVEWLYDPETKTITDGEYTSGARASALIGEDGMSFSAFSGGQNYELWLDLTLPIYNPEDPTKDYWIAGVTSERNGSACSWKRVRFGPRIVSMPGAMFYESANLEETEHFGQIQVESLAGYFFYNYGNGGPIKSLTYEAEDAYPSSLKRFGYAAFSEGPKLKGKITVGLNNLENFSQLIGRAAAVTNWIFTAEDLPAIGWNTASFAPTTVTFASTNLTLGANGADVFHYGDLKDLIFLAHAPSTAVMNTLTTTYLKNTNTVIHCSKYAPGWRELRMKGYTLCPEWNARPAGCWGIYQTADGKKRFYLVQKDSKYDVRKGMMVLVK